MLIKVTFDHNYSGRALALSFFFCYAENNDEQIATTTKNFLICLPSLEFLLLRPYTINNAITTMARTRRATPPITPPTIAPIFTPLSSKKFEKKIKPPIRSLRITQTI